MREGLIRVARLPATTDRNPYQQLLYRHLVDQGVHLVGGGQLTEAWLADHRSEVDLLHVHWRLDRLVDDDQPLGPPRRRGVAEAAEDAAKLGQRLRRARELGYRIAWTVHEIAQLGRPEPSFEHLAAEELGRAADIVLTHNQVATAHVRALRLAPEGRIRTTPLGHYGDAHPVGRGPSRADLGIDEAATVVLAFGHPRPDKDLGLLVDAFALVPHHDAVLVIAGVGIEPSEWTGRDPHGRVIAMGEVPDDQVVGLHRLADLTVAARSYEWTPSSLVLSLSLGVPVVAADLASVAEHGGPGVFPFRPGSAAELASALARAIDDPMERRVRGDAGRAFVRAVSWNDTARATAAAFRDALTLPPPRLP